MGGYFRVSGCWAVLAVLALAPGPAWPEGSPRAATAASVSATSQAASGLPSVVLIIAPPPGGFPPEPSQSAPAPVPSGEETAVPAPPDPEPVQPSESPPAPSAPAAETAAPSPGAEPAQPTQGEAPVGEAPEGEAAPQIAAEPPPPPAHPVVAKIREKLAEPAAAKGAAADDLAALQAFYGERTEPPVWTTDDGLSPKAKAAIREIKDAARWGLDTRAFDPPSADVRPAGVDEQADAEIELGLAILKYARYARGGRFQPSRVHRLFDQKPPVRAPAAVLAEIAAAEATDAYLRSQHPKHPQFQKLREALSKADNERQKQQITANMERWRWLPAELGAFHIWNNVPEFNTRVVKGGKTIYAAKTIVGQLRYATPLFSAAMSSIVFHPEWNVPETILREDIQPALQRSRGGVAILQQHNLQVSHKGQPIDPRSVDWNSVNIRQYRFMQPPGPRNPLGQFKFNFPNRHAIYMHDTPQRHLFAKQVRTLSHGCIRVNEPERLAALLLAEDKGWSAQKVRATRGGGHKVVPLKRHIPVHLTYFTMTVDESGRLQTFADYYGVDGPTARALFGNAAVKFQTPAAPPAERVAADSPRRQQAERRRGGRDPIASVFSGLFGN